ncbi:hypothetical protein, partial [Nocardioides sp.]|uniref:hypothetical protein n=1 Tax=Nocardioides sp. TaxID=35761 RepID=UPI002B27A656
MVAMPSRRTWISVVLAVALVVTALLIGLGLDQDDTAARPDDPGADTSTTEVPAVRSEVTPDEFCVLFLTFADASSSFSADLDVA